MVSQSKIHYTNLMHLVLIDFNNIFFRAFFIGDKIYTKRKHPIGAACAFIQYMNTLVRTLAPTHIVLARDMGKQTWRHQLYQEYKQHRSKTDPELSAQFCLGPYIADYLEMPLVGFDEFEADDCIATLAVEAQKFATVTIVSTDKDLLQLLNDKVRMYNPHTKTFHYKEFIGEKFQIKPHQVRDYLSLIGDSADNLPGVPGIGPKSAVEILQYCNTTEDIYSNLQHYKNSVREKLKSNEEVFKLMHKLIGLVTDISELKLNGIEDMNKYKAKSYHVTNLIKIKEYLESRLDADGIISSFILNSDIADSEKSTEVKQA